MTGVAKRPLGTNSRGERSWLFHCLQGEAHGIDAKVVAEGQAILDDKSVSIGEVKDNFLAFCERIGLLTHGVLHTDVLLPHPKNRGGLVLNGNNAHRNGSKIRRVGANVVELHGAVSMEMSPDPAKRQDTALIEFTSVTAFIYGVLQMRMEFASLKHMCYIGEGAAWGRYCSGGRGLGLMLRIPVFFCDGDALCFSNVPVACSLYRFGFCGEGQD